MDEPGPDALHVIAKPVGPLCNLDCAYCFYLEKKALFGARGEYRMSAEVLRAFVRGYLSSAPGPVVEFVWQGGEPTLAGLDFFKKVVELQESLKGDRKVANSLQTNGTLLSDEWCDFLKHHNFMVGLSLDGPKEIHDRLRRDRHGKGTFDRAMKGLALLKKHGVEYNVLTSVTRESAKKPLEIYHFLKGEGVGFIQFTPVVERHAGKDAAQTGLRLAGPADLARPGGAEEVTEWSVLPEEYGDFLIAIYEEWVRHDVGSTFVMNFEWALNAWIGNPSPVCVHADQCGRCLVIEHNGDVYACDHCVYPEYRLGNILTESLADMATKSLASGFGIVKETALPRWCKECDVKSACRGGCPKHRFAESCFGEPGLQYLCEGYGKFFRHIMKYCHAMTQLLEHGYPASRIMDAMKGPLVIRQ